MMELSKVAISSLMLVVLPISAVLFAQGDTPFSTNQISPTANKSAWLDEFTASCYELSELADESWRAQPFLTCVYSPKNSLGKNVQIQQEHLAIAEQEGADAIEFYQSMGFLPPTNIKLTDDKTYSISVAPGNEFCIFEINECIKNSGGLFYHDTENELSKGTPNLYVSLETLLADEGAIAHEVFHAIMLNETSQDFKFNDVHKAHVTREQPPYWLIESLPTAMQQLYLSIYDPANFDPSHLAKHEFLKKGLLVEAGATNLYEAHYAAWPFFYWYLRKNYVDKGEIGEIHKSPVANLFMDYINPKEGVAWPNHNNEEKIDIDASYMTLKYHFADGISNTSLESDLQEFIYWGLSSEESNWQQAAVKWLGGCEKIEVEYQFIKNADEPKFDRVDGRVKTSVSLSPLQSVCYELQISDLPFGASLNVSGQLDLSDTIHADHGGNNRQFNSNGYFVAEFCQEKELKSRDAFNCKYTIAAGSTSLYYFNTNQRAPVARLNNKPRKADEEFYKPIPLELDIRLSGSRHESKQ